MKPTETVSPETDSDEFVRLPGLFRRWEFEQVLEPGSDFHVEPAGRASDGTALFAMYRREAHAHGRRASTHE